VLARKWRPQVFEAVVGQDAITRTLRNALASGRIAHAYLFAGPRGVGKTTTARLLAKALLCPARTGAEPCGACDVCREMQAGTLVDVLEIDGASNRGIDEIRTLRENVKYAPARGRYKVYIIDEVHQLTEAAFNALLKTLEEPPAHVVFVLATTDPREIPATVLSRVQRFDFRPIAPEALVAALEHILGAEGITFEPSALPAIVRAAEGSLRDALSLLDTAIAYGDGRLEAVKVAELLGTTAPEVVRAFVAAVIGHDTGAALETIDRAAADGEDLAAFARDVVELLRRALVLKAAPSAQVADLSRAERAALDQLAAPASLDELLYMLRAFLEADGLMRQSPHPRVELEIATVRATRRPVPQAIDEVLRRLDELQVQLRQPGGLGAPAASTQVPEQPGLLPGPEARRTPPAPRRAQVPTPPRPTAPEGAVASPATAVAAGPAPAAADLATAWERVVDEVMRRRPTLGAVLTQARPMGVDGRELVLALSGNHFHREMLSDSANRDIVVQAVRRWIASAEHIRVQASGEAPGEATAHPAVQAALAEFQGEVVAVRPRMPEGELQ